MRTSLLVCRVGWLLLAACGDPEVRHVPDALIAPDSTPDTMRPDAGPSEAFNNDFEATLPPEVAPGSGVLTPSQGYAPLGPPGNQFGSYFLRSPTGNTVTLTVNLPAHSAISISFLFAAIDSLDGSGVFPAGDYFRIDLDGTQIFRESFANATPDQIQSYTPPPGVELARRVDLGFQGPGGYYTDSAYDMGADPQFGNIPHTAPTATITFTLEGVGVQSLDDESWAVDNLRIISKP